MTRRGILIAYKLVAPLAALCLILGTLDELGVIDISERGLPDALYTPFVMVMFGAVFLVPVLLILCPIIVFRFRSDRPVMLPALLLFVALLALFGPAFAGTADSFQWPGGVLFVAFIIAATWAGYFAPNPSK
jgi:hypothetical protein